MDAPFSVSRRRWLGGLAALLAAGRWPGTLDASPSADEAFSFVVANDFHHDSPACDPWFSALFAQMRTHPGLACCLALGDLAHRGHASSIARLAALARNAQLPFWHVPGNHDNDQGPPLEAYAATFPHRINSVETIHGWQFVLLDSTTGKAFQGTAFSPATLAWLETTLTRLDPARPTVLATHFPLGDHKFRPLNADAVLERFLPFNLQAVFCGHHHGVTSARLPQGGPLLTNVCCSRVAGNHDGDLRKGYWLCHVHPTSPLRIDFIPFQP